MTEPTLRFRFGVRLLLLFVCLASALSGWLYWERLRRRYDAAIPGVNQRIAFHNRFELDESGFPISWRIADRREGGGIQTLDSSGWDADAPEYPIADSDLSVLEDCVRLESIEISGVNITDAGLKSLESLATLESLDLDAPLVTFKGVSRLRNLPGLKSLFIRRSSLSQSEIDELRHLMPACEIEVDERGPLYRLVSDDAE